MKSRRFMLFVTALVFVFFIGSFHIWRVVNAPFHLKPEECVVLAVKPSMTTRALVDSLKEKNLIQNPRTVIRYIQLMGLAKKFKVGIYEIKQPDSVKTFLDKVVKGQVLIKALTIVEGSTMEKLTQTLERAPFLTQDSPDFSYLSGSRYPGFEGLVLADTYFYQAGSGVRKLMERANANLFQFLNQTWANRSPNLPYNSAYKLLIVASILEKETASPAEKKLISGVIVNRLKLGMPLQMDPTVIYALKANYLGKLHHADLLLDSPYNTYKYRGLPPTPIAIVGKESILAAAHPTVSSYLYFVADGNGKHIFSTNYNAQRKAIEQYKSRESHGN